MLQSMRVMAKSPVFKTLMMLLIVSFAIWGVGDIFRDNPQQHEVARSGSAVITRMMLEQRFQTIMPQARKKYGSDFTAQEARQRGLLDQALVLLLEETSFDQESARLGLRTTRESAFDVLLTTTPELRDENGRFRKEAWDRALRDNQFSEALLLEQSGRTFTRRLLHESFFGGNRHSKTLLDALFNARGARRVLEVLSMKHDSVAAPSAPDAAALEAFHRDHPEQFTPPEYRGLTLVRLDPEGATATLAITEADLRAAYDAQAAGLMRPEQRDFVQVVLQDEAKAKKLAESAEAAGDLARAAKAQNMTAVPLDRVDEKSVLPELYTAFFALEEGQIAGPVQSSLGWHVAQLKAVHPAGKLPFEAAKEQLQATLKQERASDALAKAVNQLDDAIGGGRPLEDIADSMKLRLVKIPALDSRGKAPDGKEPAELPAREAVLKALFEQNTGDTSALIDDKKGGYVAVRTDSIAPSQLPPLDSIRDKVLAGWQRAEKARLAAQQAEAIANELRDGKKIAAYAARPGVEVRLSRPLSTLDAADPDVPPAAVPSVLMMRRGDVITFPDKDRHYVLRLADIVAADPAQNAEALRKMAEEVQESAPMELIEQYARYLHRLYPQKTDEETLAALRQQGS